MGRLDWLLAPLRAGKRIPKPVLLATAAALAGVGGAFGIALAVVEWRDEGVDLTGVQRQLDDLDASVRELEGRLNKVTPAPSPTLAPTPTPAPTPAPTPTPTPEPGSSRDNPVPQGQAALVQDWEVTVLNWCRGPTAGCGTSLGSKPAVGVRLRAVNVSAGEPAKFLYTSGFYELPFNIVYATGSADECRFSEEGLSKPTVQGGTVEGDIHCYAAPDETSLLLLIGGRYFALG